MALALEGHRDAEKLLVQNQRDKHTTDVAKGTVDLDAAEKDMKLVPKPLRDQVLEDLKKPALPSDPTVQRTITLLDSVDPSQRAAAIAASKKLTPPQADALYKHYGLEPPAVKSAETVPPVPGAEIAQSLSGMIEEPDTSKVPNVAPPVPGAGLVKKVLGQ
jgi:hypothetical protein